MNLPVQLKSRRKGLISIKNKDQKCFLYCHVRHINPSKEHPEIEFGIEFPVQEKDFCKIEVKNNICINVFGYEDELVFPIYVSNQKLKDSIDLLILNDDDKSHYVYIDHFDDLCVTKQKIKTKNGSVNIFIVF